MGILPLNTLFLLEVTHNLTSIYLRTFSNPCSHHPLRLHYLLQLTFCDHTTTDAHTLQLLDEQLARLWNLDWREFRAILAATARPDALLRIGHSDQAALTAQPATETVTTLHEALLRELSHTVCTDGITLHLTETETTLTGTALGRLACEHHERTRSTAMQLICRAVAQTLLEHRSHKDVDLHLATIVSILEHLVTMGLKALLITEDLTQLVHRHIVERRTVAKCTNLAADLAKKRLKELCNRHTRRNAVRVNNDIWHDTICRLWHILLVDDQATRTFLTVA